MVSNTITPEMRVLLTDILFWMAISLFIVHVAVRAKRDQVFKHSGNPDKRDFWWLLSARTLACAIFACIAAMIAMWPRDG